jgi:hypothetical protein
MNVTDEMVNAACNAYDDHAKRHNNVFLRGVATGHGMKAAIEAAMQAAPEVEQEPIYEFRIRRLPNGSFDDWGVCGKEVYERYKKNPLDDFWEYDVRALYTHPQPKRAPLNDDELNSLRQRDNGKLNFVTLREFREIAKVIEKTHGIGE